MPRLPHQAFAVRVVRDRYGGVKVTSKPGLRPRGGGIIAKAQWTCTDAPTSIVLSGRTTGYFLWVCPITGTKSENWLTLNCTLTSGNGEDMSFTKSGQIRTRYVPPQPLPGAHGSGYWISCATWYSVGPNGTSSDRTNFSNWSGFLTG